MNLSDEALEKIWELAESECGNDDLMADCAIRIAFQAGAKAERGDILSLCIEMQDRTRDAEELIDLIKDAIRSRGDDQ
jgi:hypothetical protein